MKREEWIDIAKIIACILVTLGHLYQSFVASNIVQNSTLYIWFIDTIYYFHVPIFFICSGYLHGKKNINNLTVWLSYINKKVKAVVFPYMIFTLVTFLLKTLLSSSVNNEINQSLINVVFLNPLSPYWYLYTLFFCYLLVIPINRKFNFYYLILTFCMKTLIIITPENIGLPFLVESLMNFSFWFSLGTVLRPVYISKIFFKYPKISFLFFIVSSYSISYYSLNNNIISFIMGIIGCWLVLFYAYKKSNQNLMNLKLLSKYTFVIFLTHTLFASSIRIVLMKLNIYNIYIHIIFGLLSSFLVPIIFYEIYNNIRNKYLLKKQLIIYTNILPNIKH